MKSRCCWHCPMKARYFRIGLCKVKQFCTNSNFIWWSTSMEVSYQVPRSKKLRNTKFISDEALTSLHLCLTLFNRYCPPSFAQLYLTVLEIVQPVLSNSIRHPPSSQLLANSVRRPYCPARSASLFVIN